jgi:hypothetical protein
MSSEVKPDQDGAEVWVRIKDDHGRNCPWCGVFVFRLSNGLRSRTQDHHMPSGIRCHFPSVEANAEEVKRWPAWKKLGSGLLTSTREPIGNARPTRDPARIRSILERLEKLWSAHPDMRLGQLLLAYGSDTELFYAECADIIEHLERYL